MSSVIVIVTTLISFIVSIASQRNKYREIIAFDISTDHMNELENHIKMFLSKNSLSINSSIDEIGSKLNVFRGEASDEINCQAYLNPADKDGKMYVTFKKGLSNAVKNFDFAHECAHILNNDGAPNTRADTEDKPEIEQIADYTAAALLMPFDSISKKLDASNYINIRPAKRWKVIQDLCKEYNVSEIIVLRRIKEIYALKTKMSV